ncbi:hypothetical protein AGDE_02116 [Angomonas deanei]|uniref:DUF423-domain-containing protein n=1 Tax=Angomonas deanei TaxID=59799 RepID=S9WEV6_9TRYP|nr:hypothetical protein AGDE_06233 [Angomonas deanei]EPY41807.1 hypothetical protein AGDE_02116 [Angomonas deanei]CAD2214093.1 Protein of unknown function (DUF423), putative [Angomonas deanei]|eukprot:EPY37701.1 hypothetical protein AGDE_06233 [Angomonas deanei]
MFQRVSAALTGVYGCSAVMLGAYAFHGLMDKSDSQRTAFQVATNYQLMNSAAMTGVLALSASASLTPRQVKVARVSFSLIALGTALFCGTIYSKVFLEDFPISMGKLAPIGGTILMSGWATIGLLAVL